MPDLNVFEYIVLGREVSETGTPHLQGYCVFKNRKRLTGAKKVWPRAHLEIKSKHSTYEEAITYCQKDGDWDEFGVRPVSNSQKLKNKWELAFNLAKEGKLDDIEKDLLIRYYHSFKRIRQDHPSKPGELTDVCGMWFLGICGSGKSHTARAKFPDLYDKPLNKWWDGYRDEDVVLLDDVGPKQTSWVGHYLKRWADKYSFPAEQKGTTIQIRPKKIIVTSQYTIEQLFHDDDKLVSALNRRFTVTKIVRQDATWDEIFPQNKV